jgi:hypothetical protein
MRIALIRILRQNAVFRRGQVVIRVAMLTMATTAMTATTQAQKTHQTPQAAPTPRVVQQAHPTHLVARSAVAAVDGAVVVVANQAVHQAVHQPDHQARHRLRCEFQL